GNKIQASCKKKYLLSLGAECLVGEWKNLENFQVDTDLPIYKLSFMKFTSIDPYEYNNNDMFLDLVKFETILSGQLDNNLLIDVVGQAIDIGAKLTLQCMMNAYHFMSNTGGKYKPTKLNHKMTITNETVFTDSDHHK
ncbi:hypothetical protein HID58_048529, partial [Brassica napus]